MLIFLLRSPPAPIACQPNRWRGTIHPHSRKISCQSIHIYGEADYLVSHIPENLSILGRLRLNDLWNYVRESLIVRDVLILTITSSSSNPKDRQAFIQYVDSIQSSERAAVINKCPNSSIIRDMYLLIADTKDCPPSVLSSLFLPTIFESKQLFLVVVGSGRKTIKSINGSNENYSSNNLTYRPIVSQSSISTRDPRLLKMKDPRLNRNEKPNENVILSTLQFNDTKQTTMP